MTCAPILALLALCTATPEGPPGALPLADEQPAAACLTKQQAREKYPGAWLYWHGKNHCWDNRGHRKVRPSPVKEQTFAQAPVRTSNPKTRSVVADASGNGMQRLVPRIEVYYPALIQEQFAVANDLYTVQRPITEWPLMLDLDSAGPDPDNGIDGCCWPPLEQLMPGRRR